MDISTRIEGVLKAEANKKGIKVEELIELIRSGKLETEDPKLWQKLNGTFGNSLREMFKPAEKDAEQPMEEDLDEDFYEEVKRYTDNFSFLLGNDAMSDDLLSFAIKGHRGFKNDEYYKRFMTLKRSANLFKKEVSHNRFESEEEVIRRILAINDSKRPKKEKVEIRILRERLAVIEKNKENYRW